MPTPYVYGNESREIYGDRAQANYKFLDMLWTDPDLRQDLVKLANDSVGDLEQAKLRSFLLKPPLELKLKDDIQIVVIDLQTATTISPVGLKGDSRFYIFFLPAKPSSDSTRDAQQWAEAWYHAVRESGGM